MDNIRIYGDKPYNIAVIHGGPGAPGSIASVANGLKDEFGVLEPLQSADSVEGQIEELRAQLEFYDAPFVLIGHSWGAWLVWIFASKYPEMVSHIILVGSGPFEESYTSEMMKTRFENLHDAEREKAKILFAKMNEEKLSKEEFTEFGYLMSKSDSYCPTKSMFDEDPLPSMSYIFEKVWPEAAKLRRSGKLIEMSDKIKCKITFIHGVQDPHPYQGIQDVLNNHGVDFEFILFDKCGHTPWKEKYAAERFFQLLKTLIRENI